MRSILGYPHGCEPSYKAAHVRPFRVESWEEGSRVHVLCAWIQSPGMGHIEELWGLHVRHLTLDRADGSLLHGSARIDGADVPQGADPLRAPRDVLAAAVTQSPADDAADYALYALNAAGEPGLCSLVLSGVTSSAAVFVESGGFGSLSRGKSFFMDPVILARALGRDNRHPMVAMMGDTHFSHVGHLRSPSFDGTPWGYEPDPYTRSPFAERETNSLAAFSPCPGAVVHALGRDGLVSWRDIADWVRAPVMAALAPVRAFFATDVTEFVNAGLGQWSPKAYMFYTASGEAGMRRRQAARLYPVFAPLFAHDAELARLIDAGLPYEDRLHEVVLSWPLPEGAPKPTQAQVRRLRTFGRQASFRGLCRVIAFAAHLPPEWLPDTLEDWNAFETMEETLCELALRNGLEVPVVARTLRGRWKAFYSQTLRNQQEQPEGISFRLAASNADDVRRRLLDTLVLPLVRNLAQGHARHLVEARRAEINALAGRLLYGGKSLGGILKLSHRWHVNLHRLEGSLPRREGCAAWPALTAPFTASNGIVVVPLTNVVELMEEGAQGLDRNGVPGLDHCVGGYGRQCFTGESHIFSVRQPLPGGGYRRLSTLEIGYDGCLLQKRIAGPKSGLRLRRPGRPLWAADQHRAHSNGDPDPEAVAAVDEFMRRLNRLRGGLPLDPAAVRRRDESLYDDTPELSTPENVAKAFEAWRPYLPASASIETITAELGALVEGVVIPAPEDLESLPWAS